MNHRIFFFLPLFVGAKKNEEFTKNYKSTTQNKL